MVLEIIIFTSSWSTYFFLLVPTIEDLEEKDYICCCFVVVEVFADLTQSLLLYTFSHK